jgi:signal transduction histidine kinase
LSTAIDIAQQQPAGVGDPKVVLKAYTEKLRKLGVKDVTLADAADEIQASTNPDIVGKRLIQKKRPGREYVIRGVLGDSVAGVPQTTSTLTIPVVVGDRRVGYLVITRYLDDFSEQQQEAFVSRLLATLGVFGVGILLSLYLSWTFSKPLRALTKAARNVAAGDLSVRVDPGGGSEIASLSENFNEMVERLREKRQLEERLHFAERSTALGRLASAVAHEIRNPLNFINLSIDHVRERMAPADARKEDFERILRNMKSEISRLNRLVGDFLSFGKPMRLDIRSCALDEVLREVASLVDHKARDQGITLQVEAAATLPRVTADPELLKTCFLNLMINAVDAMPDGGLLTVAIREGKAEDGLPLVEVSVSDTGQGMSPEAVNSAFEPYFSTKDAGLGLGLALTHKIVSDHGGSIVLESAPDHGTTARIQLPLRASGSPATRSEDLASALVAGSR